MANYLRKHTNKQLVPPTEQLNDKQIANDGGGFGYKIDCWKMLNRFLITGAEGGTYYVSEKKQVDRNLKNLKACLKVDGIKTVQAAVEISLAGRAPKNDQAVLVLALASVDDNIETRKAAYENLHKVCRTGTHLYQFVGFRTDFEGGWGKGARKAVGDWFVKKSADKLALQVAKYKQREGWSARDVLRLAHPVPPTPEHEAIFNWTCGEPKAPKDGEPVKHLRTFGNDAKLPAFLAACDEIATVTDVATAVRLIREHKLPREVVPTALLNEVRVWEALLEDMPMTAMVRNLGKMSAIGLISTGSAASKKVAKMLGDKEELKKSRMHPINMLMAMKTYQGGHGIKGSLSWRPSQAVLDAMQDAFYLCFGNVEPMNKPTLIGLDVSGSMGGFCYGESGVLTPREITAAMAMVTLRTEKEDCTIMGFSHNFVDLGIGRRDSLDTITNKISRLPFGPTNCSEPMLWALQNKVAADAFIIYTDNDVNAGRMHPSSALKKYRKETGRDSKMIVCATTATDFSIADQDDMNSLDIAGFDSATPAIICDFVSGRI
jgi:60 kDa SS-A/Ro ribonucleoprotein